MPATRGKGDRAQMYNCWVGLSGGPLSRVRGIPGCAASWGCRGGDVPCSEVVVLSVIPDDGRGHLGCQSWPTSVRWVSWTGEAVLELPEVTVVRLLFLLCLSYSGASGVVV